MCEGLKRQDPAAARQLSTGWGAGQGWKMFVEKRIDDLIEAGWHVLDSDFDKAAFQHWRKQAVECLTDLLGPDHAYTRSFRNHVQSVEEETRRTRGGVPLPRPKKASP